MAFPNGNNEKTSRQSGLEGYSVTAKRGTVCYL